MASKYRITYDSDKADAFFVHMKDGIIEFTQRPDGLYAYKPSDNFRKKIADIKNPVTMLQSDMETTPTIVANAVHQLQLYVDTVKDNMTGFTGKEIKGAKEVRALYHKFGCPTYENFKHLVKT
jgi:hypothetical protein